jgi:hypothetical protein
MQDNNSCVYYDFRTRQCSKLLSLFSEYGYPCICTNLGVYKNSDNDGHCDYYRQSEDV